MQNFYWNKLDFYWTEPLLTEFVWQSYLFHTDCCIVLYCIVLCPSSYSTPYADDEADKVRMRTVLEPDYAFTRLNRSEGPFAEARRFMKRLLELVWFFIF